MFCSIKFASTEAVREILSKKGSKIYFIGIGGVSMSSLAQLCLEKGLSVYGSDIRKNEATLRLEACGARIFYIQSEENVYSVMPHIAVSSLAIAEDNPEISALRKMGVTILERAELIGIFAREYEIVISVSGSHGKTTASAMAKEVFFALGTSPTSLIGTEPDSPYSYVRADKKIAIFEGCEYGGSFLKIRPDVQILLNLDLDHVDYYPTLDSLKCAFISSVELAERFAVVNADDPNLIGIADKYPDKAIAFSKNQGYPYRYEIIDSGKSGSKFNLYCPSGKKIEFSLRVLGKFNVVNAVAALVSADALGYDISLAKKALADFPGVGRRLEFIGKLGEISVFYDYAHHPREIESAYEALSLGGFNRIGAVFSAHTYSRTKAFFGEFSRALCKFEFAFLSEIYAAREENDGSVSSKMLAESINSLGGKSAVVMPPDLISQIKKHSIDCLVLMGAGDLSEYKSAVLNEIKRFEERK